MAKNAFFRVFFKKALAGVFYCGVVITKMLQRDFKRLQIEPGRAKWRYLAQISSFSRTWLDLEPFEALLKLF